MYCNKLAIVKLGLYVYNIYIYMSKFYQKVDGLNTYIC